MKHRRFSYVLTACLVILSGTIAAQDFPRFLGPQGNGVVSLETTISTSFDADGPQQWMITMPKEGGNKVQASPVVAGGQAYYYTVVYSKQQGGQLGFNKNRVGQDLQEDPDQEGLRLDI